MNENRRKFLRVASATVAAALPQRIPLGLAASAKPMASPVLWFSDLTSGPRTGNTDTSLGQTSGEDGIIVSVWGTGLGASQASSTIACGGAPAAKVYYWGDAIPPYSPANLNNAYQDYQLIIFQVSHLATDGPAAITVTVNGAVSNGLPFIIRPGRIFFVKTTGSDSNPGTWTQPFLTMVRGKTIGIQPGDTIYVGDGVNQSAEGATGYSLRFYTSGTEAAPISLVAYPGAVCSIGNPNIDTLLFYISDSLGDAKWHTISKFTLLGKNTVIKARTGTRTVGCKISAPRGNTPTGAGLSIGSHIHFLGNEWTNCGLPSGGSHLYHVLYSSSRRGRRDAPDEVDREIAFNYFHDNGATRAINVYTEPVNGHFAKMRDHRIHHNVVVDQESDGILMSAVHARSWIHDNILIRCKGLAMNFRGGEAAGIYVYHNTAIDCGDRTNAIRGAVLFAATGAASIAGFYNNIFWQNNGEQYVVPFFQDPKSVSPNRNPAVFTNNLWYGAGKPPSWDSNTVNSNPLLVGGTPIDAHLRSNSPAIGAGTSLVSPHVSVDFDGISRPQGAAYDIGAYEFAKTKPNRGRKK